MFGSNRMEIDDHAVGHIREAQCQALLAMLDELPPSWSIWTRGTLSNSGNVVASWQRRFRRANLGSIAPANSVGGKDVVERIRRLMLKCSDQLPPREPELPFIVEEDVRLGIEDRIQAAWTDFNAREWMGATVLAGHAIEALLLWAVKKQSGDAMLQKPPDELHLHDLIEEAEKRRLISPECKKLSELAKDARNLIHPGKATRFSTTCSKATALTALSAVYKIAEDLRSGAAP